MHQTACPTRPRFTAAAPRVGLTDIDQTTIMTLIDLRKQREEIASCRSADGVWLYFRAENAGSTWTVRHTPTGRELRGEVSLPKARAFTASGALAELDRQQALDALPRCTWVGTFSACSVRGCTNPAHVAVVA